MGVVDGQDVVHIAYDPVRTAHITRRIKGAEMGRGWGWCGGRLLLLLLVGLEGGGAGGGCSGWVQGVEVGLGEGEMLVAAVVAAAAGR